VRPQAFLRIHPGSEVMMKNFEAAAAGCAVFADWIEDMDQLGFRDGASFLGYRSFDELVEKIRYYDENVDHLALIAAAGEELCRTRHTWACRARDLYRLVSSLLHGS
jgi:spore maturation protein CgeB